jgi:hypothetical protein
MKFIFIYFVLEIVKTYELESGFLPSLPISESNLINNSLEIIHVVTDNCTSKICDFPYGYCATPKICQCYTGFVNKPNQVSFCNYERKKQLYAFFLEMIFSFGIGHIYMNRLKSAFIKLSLESLVVLLYFMIKAKFPQVKFQYSNGFHFIISVIYTLLFASFLVLYVYDIYLLSKNEYKDGNGVRLLSWDLLLQ